MLDPQERLATLIEHLNDAVYTVDVTTNQFTSLNTAAVKLTGYPLEELRGGLITAIIAPEYMPTVRKMILTKLKKDRPTVYEVELIHKSGRRIPVEISSRVIFQNGKPSEILGIARDIRERKAAERQKEIFFSLITHEIKNPLTAITMYTELLGRQAKKRNDEKDQQALSLILAQVELITQLVSDFMDVNQFQLGKFRIRSEAFDLHEVVTGVVAACRKTTPGVSITLKGRARHQVKGDRQRIRQVMDNLLSNAIKYSPEKKDIIVTVKEEGGSCTVSVQDFGIGIPTAEQKAVFDLYYRVRKQGQEQIKGHGLGLFICREIIKSHKGKIWVESKDGKGSTFSFSLPLSK